MRAPQSGLDQIPASIKVGEIQIDASNINLTKLLRSSFGNNTYIPDYFYQFIIRNDKLFSNAPTNEVNKPFILHLLTTEYYPEVIKKITALNPSFISSLSTLDFEKTNFSNLDTANIPTITGTAGNCCVTKKPVSLLAIAHRSNR